MVTGQDILYSQEVAKGFGHLFTIYCHKSVVHKIAYKWFSSGRYGLGYVIFMMRKDEILSPSMDIESLPQVADTHGRAFDVPSGSARAPGAFPGGFAWLAGLPEGKIHGMAFSGVNFYSGTGLHLFQTAMGKPSVTRELFHREEDITFSRIRIPLAYQGLNQTDDILDIPGGLWLHIRPGHAQGLHIPVEFPGIVFGKLLTGDSLFSGPVDDLVIYIGNVLYVGHLKSTVAQVANADIKNYGRTGMAQMAIIIGRNTADIDTDVVILQRRKVFLLTAKGVVQ